MKVAYTLQKCAEFIGAELVGDPDCVVSGLNTLQDAGLGQLAFLANQSYQKLLTSTSASAVILEPRFADQYSGNKLILDNPYVGYARITAWFNDAPKATEGIHETAVVAGSATIAPSAYIGPHVVIGEQVVIQAGVSIGAGTCIGDHSSVGQDTWIASNVSIYHGISIGRNVVIHSSSVIGADGFGFANERGQWIKIHQLGGVEIGDRVEIGACTTIDRGALGNTVLEDGVILDNHVQVAHNVRLGENTAMAAYAGIAGSATIGKNCIFAGQAGAVGHVTICDNVHAMARTALSKSIDKPGSYSSGVHMYETPKWRRNAARFGQLDDMAKRLKQLEKNQK